VLASNSCLLQAQSKMHKNIKKIKTKERENEKKALIRIIKLK
jgi:hypothetical protein